LYIVTSQTGAAAAAPAPRFFRRHRWKIILTGLVLAAALVVTLWTMVTLTFSYSSGDRVGYVQKFSRKGWICRTWEGELAMTPVPGSQPEIFYFTVPDNAVAKRISESEGKKVALQYHEKRGIPSSCFGDTHYFISDVRPLGQ
jgi:hypothetical protein